MSFSDIATKYHDRKTEILAFFNAKRSGNLPCIKTFKHRMDFKHDSRPFLSVFSHAKLNVHDPDEPVAHKQLEADIIERAKFQWAKYVLIFRIKDWSFHLYLYNRRLRNAIVKST